MVLSNIKTPGVYVEEVSLFPPSVAQVPTAIPAFIGYTEFAKDADGKSLAMKPTKISSLLDFSNYFGKGYEVLSYKIVSTDAGEIKSVVPDKRFYLYNALRQFYDNGGGDCYIISVGVYDEEFKSSTFAEGIATLKKYDEPTLILFPDAVALTTDGITTDKAAIADLQKLSLDLCASMQDRFAIMDVPDGDKPLSPAPGPAADFRDNIGVNALSYGAAYYPWLITNYDVETSFRTLKFFKLSAPNTELDITALADFSIDDIEAGLLEAYQLRMEMADLFVNKLYPGNPNAANRKKFSKAGIGFLREELAKLENEIASSTNATHKDKLKDYLDYLAKLLDAFPSILADVAADAPKKAVMDGFKNNKSFIHAILLLIALEKDDDVLDNTGRNAGDVGNTVYKNLFTDWTDSTAFADIDLADIDPGIDTSRYIDTKPGTLILLRDVKSKVLNAILDVYDFLFFMEKQAEKALFTNHTFFKGAVLKVKEKMQTIPASATMAGIYAMVDDTRGVWKAPANVSVNAITGPAVKIDNREQEDLNVHTTGKSINAIRSFTGKGTLVWGARTLAGNDNEWRFIPVRRFFIMVEESCKKATEPFVFEPNDANTWTRVKVMIENFLTLQWRAGALQGAKPEQAFFVHVGLGETMTQDDVLNGRMIVEIGMAAVRPAEFIILRFSHKMMEQ